MVPKVCVLVCQHLAVLRLPSREPPFNLLGMSSVQDMCAVGRVSFVKMVDFNQKHLFN